MANIDREKVISEFEDFVKSFSKRNDTYSYYKGLFVSVLAVLQEQENASKRNPVIVCPHCGKRVK